MYEYSMIVFKKNRNDSPVFVVVSHYNDLEVQ
jgi:hypothetical protein